MNVDSVDGLTRCHVCPLVCTYADAISNFTMAKQGFPRMAISACFGGPLLSIHRLLLNSVCIIGLRL